MENLFCFRSQLDTLGGDRSPPCFQNTAFGLREAREVAGAKSPQVCLEPLQPGFSLLSRGAQRRSGLIAGARLPASRIPQQGLPARRILGGSIGLEESQGFPAAECVPAERLGKTHLGAPVEATEGRSHAHGELSSVEPLRELGGELRCKLQAPGDPARLPAQELADGLGGKLVVLEKGADDPSLVHGA
jgi:hypothetical protein